MLYTQNQRYMFNSFHNAQKIVLEMYFENVYTIVAED